ncbi:hypothetical protein Pcinc_032735 [Petrolisthes cinctipes]|uniref:Beta-hexosaminidase n=1 Tax=Petrolisthes cinctipes TaxID=88211 RepID=A0AAE1K2I9_PETCI|nr:hypothetical protein Pcinc_032735 [Petrolisthes cinctipes]
MTSCWVVLCMLVPFTLTTAHQHSHERLGGGAWGWRCVNQTCVREEQQQQQQQQDEGPPHTTLSSLSTCKLTCRPDASIWPTPTGLLRLHNETVYFLLDSVTLREVRGGGGEVKGLVRDAFSIFLSSLASLIPGSSPASTSLRAGDHLREDIFGRQVKAEKVTVSVSVSSKVSTLSLYTREAYTLTIRRHNTTTTEVAILASDFYGARHALETLSQLVEWDQQMRALQMVSRGAITDAPVFRYRGLMVDTARNFLSVKALERTVDGMAATKLNTLHLHLTDSHAFPLQLPGLANMAYYGAYSPRNLYTPEDLRHLQRYARVRGVRLVPEIDAPAHAGNGWQWGEREDMGNLAVCVNKEPWREFCSEPPCGQLNPANNHTYTLLSHLYAELRSIFHPLQFFHFGGSEVNMNCWNTTDNIVEYLKQTGRGRENEHLQNLWGEFQSRAKNLLADVNRGRPFLGIVRYSTLIATESSQRNLSPEEYAVQVTGPNSEKVTSDLLQKGYRVILSHNDAWDLGAGFSGSFRSEVKNYIGWQTVYNQSLSSGTSNLVGSGQSDLMLGGEALLWGHRVDDANIDAKLWPRGAALGERLWSNPSTSWFSAEPRFIHHRQRLLRRGIMADRIQPQWCHQNEGLCYL